MDVRQRTAAWTLVALSAAGAILPPGILFLLKPVRVVRSTVQVTGQLPLDAFFLLDASGSVKPHDWALALNFAGDMASRLNASFPRFRAGLGQFSSHYQLEFELSRDLSPFRELTRRVTQLNGTTFVDRALCGGRSRSHVDACSGGALEDLTSAPALEGQPQGGAGSVGCGAQEAAKVILLVTDGMPTDGQAALLSAKYLKQTTNVTLMGVLVGGKAAHAKALYALTACCSPEDMQLEDGQPLCRGQPNWTCPHMEQSTSYADLVQSSEWFAKTLTSNMECEHVEERWNMHADLRSLWFLLLPVPMLVYIVLSRLLLCCCPAVPTDGPEDAPEPTGDAEQVDSENPAPAEDLPRTSLLESLGGTLGGRIGRPPASGSGAGYKGKKWAPVRTAYLVAGQRLDVDYGGAAPPMAPNAARRGYEQASIRDTPEAYFANLNDRGDRTLVDSLVDPAGEQIQPPCPLCWCSIWVPLGCTLVLLPPVVLWSGALDLLGRPGV